MVAGDDGVAFSALVEEVAGCLGLLQTDQDEPRFAGKWLCGDAGEGDLGADTAGFEAARDDARLASPSPSHTGSQRGARPGRP